MIHFISPALPFLALSALHLVGLVIFVLAVKFCAALVRMSFEPSPPGQYERYGGALRPVSPPKPEGLPGPGPPDLPQPPPNRVYSM